jgi:hypothetical protein
MLTLHTLNDFISNYKSLLNINNSIWASEWLNLTYCEATCKTFCEQFTTDERGYVCCGMTDFRKIFLKHLSNNKVWQIYEHNEETDDDFHHTYILCKIGEKYYKIESWLDLYPPKYIEVSEIKIGTPYYTLYEYGLLYDRL